MKKNTLTLILIFTIFNLQAQLLRSLVITAPNNQEFVVYLDNHLINNRPLSNVEITNLDKNFYHIQVLFNRQKIEGDLYVPPLSEITYQINNGYKNNFSIVNLTPLKNNGITQNGSVFPYQNILNGSGNNNNSINIHIDNNVNTTTSSTITEPQVVYVPDYNGEIGCNPPLSNSRFNQMLNSIREQDFEAAKKRVAKQIIDTNCMTTANIISILNLFDFDKDKLELAKFAYDYVYDIENYYMVNDVFDFTSNVEKLDNYIRNR